MKTPYRSYKVADFVLDREFRKWALTPDRESNIFWREWLDENPEKADTIAEAIKLIKLLPAEKFQLTAKEKSDLLQEIKRSIAKLEESQLSEKGTEVIHLNAHAILENRLARNNKSRWKYLKSVVVAASVSLIVLSLFIYKYSAGSASEQNLKSEAENISIQNPLGKRSTAVLDDGTKVILNAGSSISFARPFPSHQRVVYLEGEAFFEVSEDPQRPFEVVTRHSTTFALGTSFNILETPDKGNVKISLISGSVEVDLKGGGSALHRGIILNPGEQVEYSTADSTFSKGFFNAEEVASWKDGIIYFKDADEATVVNKLERWYGIDISVNNSKSNQWDLTARFDNQPLNTVLKSLGYTLGFKHSVEDNQVIIQF